MAAWKSGSLADKIKGQAVTSPAAPQAAPAPASSTTSSSPVLPQDAKPANAERKPQTSPAPQPTKVKEPVAKSSGAVAPESKKEPSETSSSKEDTISPATPPAPEAKPAKDEAPRAAPKPKTEAKPVDEPPPKPAPSHGPAAVAAVDEAVSTGPSKAIPQPTKPETPTTAANGHASGDFAHPARPIESDEPLVTLPVNIGNLVDKKFSFVGAIAPPPTPVAPIIPQPSKRVVDPVSAAPFNAPPYGGRAAAPIPPNYDAYQQQYAHQGYPQAAPVYGQTGYQGYGQAGYGYAPRGAGRGAYQTGLFNLPPYERGFRGGYGAQNYHGNSYRGNSHYAAPPYYANGYRAPEETEGTQ